MDLLVVIQSRYHWIWPRDAMTTAALGITKGSG